MSLTQYKRKRNFDNTPEPKAAKRVRKSKLTFVVQRHHASHLHYDFRLEMDGVLKSWAVPKGPSMVAGEKRLAVMVEDHPLSYGKFYGEIPAGNYGAGTVHIWDNGTYKPMEESNSNEKNLLAQLHKGDLKFILNGTHLKGAFALVRMGDEKNWLLIKKDDEFAEKKYKIENIEPLKSPDKKKVIAKNKSAKAKVVKEKANKPPEKKQNFPNVLPQPMLARLSDKVVNNADWIYEIKYDGYRILTAVNDGSAELVSRNGNSYTKLYSEISSELKKIKDSVILDGEVVIEDEKGKSNFQLLQNFRLSKEGKLKYYVFDILFLNGYNVTSLPLMERKELLELFFKKYSFKNIFKSDYLTGDGEKIFNKFSKKGYEGMIAKDSGSKYYPGKRTDSWLKVKTTQMQEAVIAGYTLPQNSRKFFGSLVLGIYDGNKLKYIGNCGTGFTDISLKELHDKLERIKITECPFVPKPKMTGIKGKPVWTKPELVCNVKFLEWTNDKHLRNPVFMGLREDKKAKEVIHESVKPSPETESNSMKEKIISFSRKKVKCTNPDKVYWPEDGFTKGDLINYYLDIAPYILPYLKNRPQSLHRHPNGINKESFYQKDMEVKQLPVWAKTVQIHSKSNDADLDYLICNDTATLIYMANLGCIEINPWHSRYQKTEFPDYVMLDLDPADISFKDVVDNALAIKEICDEINIPCYCKTSGATGLHIYIPLAAKYRYDYVKTFAEILATITHQRLPDTTSIERAVAKRKDKVYIDFLQNSKGQTIAAPYSVRPRPHATVSTPLLWKEVNHQLSPEMFTIKNIKKRIEKIGDLWEPVIKRGINLVKTLKLIEKL